MAEELLNIHTRFLEKMNSRCKLSSVGLKHPFPERPLRALGFLKIDGAVYETDRFLRVMVLTTQVLSTSRCSRSIFLGPRPDFHLPIFSSENILMGGKRAFLVDIHTTVCSRRWGEVAIEDRLLAIRGRYEDLMGEPLTMKGPINTIMSPAYCYVKVQPEMDARALSLFNEYLDVFLELVEQAAPVAGESRQEAAVDFENYHQTIMNHDPAVKLYSMLFGKAGGTERVNDLFFAR
ncbi:MAG: hypothetical protein JW832_09530 [Deltaproteobacteria bacterium]|nr:hypothetical protein [Deltaproteobacteria bacterium]